MKSYRKLSSSFTIFAMATLTLIIFGGCGGDPNAEFRPNESNTPPIPVNDAGGRSNPDDEDDEAATENLY
ncbi:MAG: hypothetical protein AAGA30_05170 [Planctomycetota bacterium]